VCILLWNDVVRLLFLWSQFCSFVSLAFLDIVVVLFITPHTVLCSCGFANHLLVVADVELRL